MDDLEIHRGDARTITVPLTLDGVAWEIPVGTTIRCTGKLRRDAADAAAVFAKTTADDITAVASTATIVIDPADTDGLAAANVNTTIWCDVQVSGAGFGPWTVAVFRIIVVPDSTRTAP